MSNLFLSNLINYSFSKSPGKLLGCPIVNFISNINFSQRPTLTGLIFLGKLPTLTKAKSSFLLVAIILPNKGVISSSNSLSDGTFPLGNNQTATSSALSITCQLVKIIPGVSIKKPDPTFSF